MALLRTSEGSSRSVSVFVWSNREAGVYTVTRHQPGGVGILVLSSARFSSIVWTRDCYFLLGTDWRVEDSPEKPDAEIQQMELEWFDRHNVLFSNGYARFYPVFQKHVDKVFLRLLSWRMIYSFVRPSKFRYHGPS